MPVYVIVSKDKPTLGPNEIRAGDKFQVSNGDSFIVSSSANANISFQSGGGPAEFDLSFAGSNANGFDIKIEGGLKPSATI